MPTCQGTGLGQPLYCPVGSLVPQMVVVSVEAAEGEGSLEGWSIPFLGLP